MAHRRVASHVLQNGYISVVIDPHALIMNIFGGHLPHAGSPFVHDLSFDHVSSWVAP